MLEQYFLRPTTVDRIRSNWLGPQIERYVEWMHAQKYARQNVTRRVGLLCHFADFAKTNGAADLASAPSLVEKFGDHWMAGNRCWNLETRPKLRRDICSIIRQMLLILESRVTRERGHPPFQFQSEAPGVTFEVPKLLRLSNVPRSITWGEVRRVLEVVDRRTVHGRRDYAILLMLVTYGLRACEVAKLTNCTAYPLAGVVAEA